MTIQIQNLNKAPKEIKAKHASLLGYWESQSKQQISYCSNNNCFNHAQTAALLQKAPVKVQRNTIKDDNWYIVPLCQECGDLQADEMEEIVNYVELVPATQN